MASGSSEKDRTFRLSTELFQRIEFGVYLALGVLLSVTALLTLGSATLLLLEGMRDWSGTRAIFLVVDRLMFVLMLIEILHTVRGSVRSGALTPEPFLIIGLIASSAACAASLMQMPASTLSRNRWDARAPR
jgi:hypothetical protein